MQNSPNYCLAAAISLLLCLGCKKEYLDLVPVANYTVRASGTSNDLNLISFPTETVGYVAGYQGPILKTSDGGQSWVPLPAFAGYAITALDFMDANRGLCRNNGALLRTTDGGATWANLGYSNAIAVGKSGFAVNVTGTSFAGYNIQVTTDFGATFNPVVSFQANYASELGKSYIIDDNHIFVCVPPNENSVFFVNLDTGIEIDYQCEQKGVNSVYFESKNWSVASGGQGCLSVHDGSNSPYYAQKYYGSLADFKGIDGRGKLVIAVAHNGMISNYGGTTATPFREVVTPEGGSILQPMNEIKFVGGSRIFVVGDGGMIWEMSNDY